MHKLGFLTGPLQASRRGGWCAAVRPAMAPRRTMPCTCVSTQPLLPRNTHRHDAAAHIVRGFTRRARVMSQPPPTATPAGANTPSSGIRGQLVSPQFSREGVRHELKILASLAAATLVVTTAWTYNKRTPSRDIVEMAARGAEERVAGRPKEARKHYAKAKAVLQHSHASDEWHVFTTTFAVGDTSLEAGDPHEALSQFTEAERLCGTMEASFSQGRLEKLGIRLKHAVTLDRLAQLWADHVGDVEEALRFERRAEAKMREHAAAASDKLAAAALAGSGPVSSAKDAQVHAGAAVARVELAGVLNNKARLLARLERWNDAEEAAQEVIRLCRGAKGVHMASRFVDLDAEAQSGAGAGRTGSEDAQQTREPKGKGKSKRRKKRSPTGPTLEGVAQELLRDVREARDAATAATSGADAVTPAGGGVFDRVGRDAGTLDALDGSRTACGHNLLGYAVLSDESGSRGKPSSPA